MQTTFEHKYNIGDTVFLVYFSRGAYRVRKKSGYRIEFIRFNYWKFNNSGEPKKDVYYRFEGKNPSVSMTEEIACFPSLEEAQKYCDVLNDKIRRKTNALF